MRPSLSPKSALLADQARCLIAEYRAFAALLDDAGAAEVSLAFARVIVAIEEISHGVFALARAAEALRDAHRTLARVRSFVDEPPPAMIREPRSRSTLSQAHPGRPTAGPGSQA